MKKRWFILVIFLLFLNLASVTAILEDYATNAKCVLIIDKPEIALVKSPFTIGIKYYFTNQQVRDVELALYSGSRLVSKETYGSEETVQLNFDLNEAQVAAYPYSVRIRERVNEDEYAETRIDFTISVISDSTEEIPTRHEFILVSGSSQPYLDDLSGYEPYGLRDKLNYSIIQKNPSKVDCYLDASVIIFEPAGTFTGRTTCTVMGSYGNLSVKHTYSFLVVENKKLKVENLTNKNLNNVTEGDVTYKNLTSFCSYEIKDRDNPVVYLNKETKDYNLVFDHEDLKIYNISQSYSGTELVSVGCNDQFREFYLSINEKTAVEDSIRYEENKNKEILDFGFGTMTLTKPLELYVGEKNPLTIAWNLQTAENISLQAFLTEPGIDQVELKVCNPSCHFDLFSQEASTKEYALSLRIDDVSGKPVGKKLGNYEISSDGTSYEIRKTINFEFLNRKADPLAEINNNLGIIRPPFSSDAEKAIARITTTADQTSFEAEKERITATASLIEATKVIGLSSKVNEKGERFEVALIKIKIHPKKKLTNLVVYEYIPKVNANSIADVEFKNAFLESMGGSFEIIQADPVVAWHFPKLDKDIELSYELSKETTIIGNTIIISSIPAEGSKSYLIIVIILGVILVIVIILVILRVLRRFRKKIVRLEKEVTHEASAIEKKLKTTESYIVKRLEQGHRKEEIALDLVKSGWPNEIVEKIFKRLNK